MKSFLVLASAALVACALAACSNSDDSTDTAGAGDAGANATAIAEGLTIVQANACQQCHGADLSGDIKEPAGNYSANITPDQATGIGSWTLTDLTNALRESIDDQGQALCSPMPKFPALTDTDISNLYAYLRSIPAVSKAQPDTECDGTPVTN